VHNIVSVKSSYSLTDLLKDPPDNLLGHVAAFDAFEESAAVSVLQHHVGDILFFFVIVVEQLDDAGVVEPAMQHNLIFRVFVVDLS
jgi:hypothetical protein